LFEHNGQYNMNLDKIATVGFSLGGHLAPLAAAYDTRICCTVGNSGFAQIGGIEGAKKLNPIWQRGINFMTGFDDFEEAVKHFDLDITKAPQLECPLLFFHAGHDEVMPSPKKQADLFMAWAKGEKELKYYPESEHCTVDRLDDYKSVSAVIDWLFEHNGQYNMNLDKIATVGFSLGGHLAPLAAASAAAPKLAVLHGRQSSPTAPLAKHFSQ